MQIYQAVKLKINVQDKGRDGVDWVNLAEDRSNWLDLGSTVSNLWVLFNVGSS
jgi:hypothetical protein